MNSSLASEGEWSVLVGASNEADLIAKSRDGDHTAYVSLLQLHDAHLRRFVFNSFGSTEMMDNILEEVYLDALGPLRSEIDEPPFGTWLFGRVFGICEAARADLSDKHSPDEDDSDVAVALLEMPLDDVAAISMVAGEMVDEDTAAAMLRTDPKPFARMVADARELLEPLVNDDNAYPDELIASYRPARHGQDFWVSVNRSFGPAPTPLISGKGKKKAAKAASKNDEATDDKASATGRRWLPRMSGLVALLAAVVVAIIALTAMFGGSNKDSNEDEGTAPAPMVLVLSQTS